MVIESGRLADPTPVQSLQHQLQLLVLGKFRFIYRRCEILGILWDALAAKN
jgi:hypothetical protein